MARTDKQRFGAGPRCARVPPARLLAAYRGAAKVVEVAVGTDFTEALAAARALPGTQVVVTDVDPRVRAAPAPLRGEVDDLLRPQRALFEGAALVYAVRLPEELHAAALRVAQVVGADLALRLLGDDEPALPPADAPFEGGWRLWRARRG